MSPMSAIAVLQLGHSTARLVCEEDSDNALSKILGTLTLKLSSYLKLLASPENLSNAL